MKNPAMTQEERRTDSDRRKIRKVRKAIFPAAGLGTRFLPATKAQPKEMLPLADKPIIQYGVEDARGKRQARVAQDRAANFRHDLCGVRAAKRGAWIGTRGTDRAGINWQ